MNKEHPTAETIYESLKRQIPALSLGTVYRNLRLLEELGKIRRVPSNRGGDRYDAICGDHVHFVCQDCGSIRDLLDVDTELLRKSIPLYQGYEPSKLDLTLTGLCPNCTQIHLNK